MWTIEWCIEGLGNTAGLARGGCGGVNICAFLRVRGWELPRRERGHSVLQFGGVGYRRRSESRMIIVGDTQDSILRAIYINAGKS